MLKPFKYKFSGTSELPSLSDDLGTQSNDENTGYIENL